MILSVAVVYPAGALPHRHKADKDVLKEIRRARLTGHYGDLTNKPEHCDSQERNSGEISCIVVHSTHVVPSLSFEEVLSHSLTTCVFDRKFFKFGVHAATSQLRESLLVKYCLLLTN